MQTLPEREGDPEPPPDNGQHIALGCFTEYLRFLDRVGEGGSSCARGSRCPCSTGRDGRGDRAAAGSLLRYRHLPLRDRMRIPLVHGRLRGRARASRARRSARCCAGSAHRTRRSTASGTSSSVPRSTSGDEVDAEAGLFTVRTALLGPRANSDLVLPRQPLGGMHGDAAGPRSGRRGDRLADERVESLDDLDADAIVVAVPPGESARLLGEDDPGSRTRRS